MVEGMYCNNAVKHIQCPVIQGCTLYSRAIWMLSARSVSAKLPSLSVCHTWVTTPQCGGLLSHCAKNQQTVVGVAGLAVGHATTSVSK